MLQSLMPPAEYAPGRPFVLEEHMPSTGAAQGSTIGASAASGKGQRLRKNGTDPVSSVDVVAEKKSAPGKPGAQPEPCDSGPSAKRKKGDPTRRAVVAAPASKSPVGRERDADDLDALFGGLTKAKAEARARAAAAAEAAVQEADAARKAAAAEKRARAAEQRNGSGLERDIFGEVYDSGAVINPMGARVHRFDNPSGLNVYKAQHLGLGRGGGTPLCPFDCSCCF